ncbi:MAG: Os1348 family NHLP clan protein [Chloroflexota bacterium]|nr:Os1348 family NHLP clan protein [Chloroflexota bacterium]
MSRESIAQLMDRWINEPQFRAEMRRDPEGAVRRSGVQLTEDEMAALRSIDWSQPDEELRARVNKC